MQNDIICTHGELSERFKEPVLKTGDGETHREFESHTLRQKSALPYRVRLIFLEQESIGGVCRRLVVQVSKVFYFH